MLSITPYHTLPYPQTLKTAFETVIAYHKTLALFQALEAEVDFTSIYQVAQKFTALSDVIILGTGGSSLAGQTLNALREYPSPRLHFCDNIDPHTFHQLSKQIQPETTGLLIISKSGNTAETLMQALLLMPSFQNHKNNVHVITQPGESALQSLATYWGVDVTPHPPHIGGRYSAFTVVGLLPAAIAGLRSEEVVEGARKYLKDALTSPDTAPFIAAAQAIASLRPISVLMPYCDRLVFFSQWYRQLWAESLGKEGKGSTPVPALGAVDQHSQLQLYLDGPNDKLFTILQVKEAEEGPSALPVPLDHPALTPLIGQRMGDLFHAEAQATVETLRQAQKPVRTISVNTLNETSLGALMMHFILETLASAALLGVNPFDQPAVEAGKQLTHHYLAFQSAY